MNVALVVMPFAAVTRPSLAVGLLQANLRRVGIHCEAVYANLVLGEMLGGAAYRRFSSEAAITALAGEWAFSQLLYGQRVSTCTKYAITPALPSASRVSSKVAMLVESTPSVNATNARRPRNSSFGWPLNTSSTTFITPS